MAKELAFTAKVDLGDGAKSIRTLKDEFKAAQKELDGLSIGTSAYVKQLEKLGGLKNDIESLNTEISAFDPQNKLSAFGNVLGGLAGGFSAAQGAMALFGAEGEDLQKTLVKVQAGMAFAEGIKGVMGLADGFTVLGNVLKANPIMMIATILIAATAAIYGLYKALNQTVSESERLTKELEKQHAANEALSKSSKRQIDLLTAQGASEREIIAVKEKLIQAQIFELQTSIKLHEAKLAEIKDNDSIWETTLKVTAAIRSKMGDTMAADAIEKAIQINKQERAKEDLDAISKEKEDLLDLQNNIKILNEEKIQIYKKETAEYKKDEEDKVKYLEERIKKEYDLLQAQKAQKEAERLKQAETDATSRKETALTEATEKTTADQLARDQALYNEQYFREQDNETAANRKKNAEDSVNLASQSAEAMKAIADVVFTYQLKKAHGNAAEELKIRKKQFQFEKAFNITRTAIDTVRGAMTAIANNPPPSPVGIISAVLTGVMGAAAIAKIASTKFDPGSSGGGGSISLGGGASGGVPLAPPSTGSTLLNPDGTIKAPKTGGNNTVKAVVVETDIKQTTNRVNSIEEKSKIR